MAKNITIAEGTQGKNFNTVHKLRTNLIGGGTQYWVPEDEAGAYANLSEKTITENGTYRASDDNKDGYSQVIVNVPPKQAHLSTKSITENGIYKGIDDGVDGFSQVNVNVAGVGEVITTLDEPIGGDGNEHLITTDPSTGKVKDIILPSSIKITTLPTKMNYQRGQSTDITGIVVKAYKKDGTLWESTGYTGGVIPISELIVSPTIVNGEEAYKEKNSSLVGNNIYVRGRTLELFATEAPEEYWWWDKTKSYRGDLALFAVVGGNGEYEYYVNVSYFASSQPFYVDPSGVNGHGEWEGESILVDGTDGHGYSYTYDNKTVYYYLQGEWSGSKFVADVPLSQRAQETGMLAWTMVYGSEITVYKENITIGWKRPHDNKKLIDAFVVDVDV